jgi:NTP pyrophosphatase (non-canonical NTP hydrolase)
MNSPSNPTTAAVDLLHRVGNLMQHCPLPQQTTVEQLVDSTSSELEEIKALAKQTKTNAPITGPINSSSDDLDSKVGDLLFDAFLLARLCERDFTGCSLEGMFERVTEKIQAEREKKSKEKATSPPETKSNHASSRKSNHASTNINQIKTIATIATASSVPFGETKSHHASAPKRDALPTTSSPPRCSLFLASKISL